MEWERDGQRSGTRRVEQRRRKTASATPTQGEGGEVQGRDETSAEGDCARPLSDNSVARRGGHHCVRILARCCVAAAAASIERG